jgi:conjugal transfer ATP-binding protein TraC
VVLELEALNAKPDLQTVVLFLLMKRITEAMYLSGRSQRKICIIDEAWRLLGSGNSSLVIEEGFRICRKYNGSFMTVTQSLVDYYKSPTAAAAYANSDFVFLLRQKPESLAEIEMKGYLVMSPFEKRVYGSVTTFGGRYSEIAIKSPDGLAVGQLIVDKFSGKLMSTKAEDVHAIKMFEQQGFSKLEAIKKVALA